MSYYERKNRNVLKGDVSLEYAVIILAVLLLALAFMVGGVIEEKRKKALFLAKLRSDYGKPSDKQYPEGRMKTIGGYAAGSTIDFFVDDITWNDLDMDRIFQMLDFTYSAAGEEVLYALLRNPKMDTRGFDTMEELITYFMEHQQERISLQLLFARIGRTGKYSIFDYLDRLDALGERSNRKHFVLLAALAVSVCLCFVSGRLGALLVFLCVMTNIAVYFKEKREILPYLTTFSYLLRLLNSVRQFEALSIERIRDDVETMKNCFDNCKGFYRGSGLVTSMNQTSSNPLEFVMDYVRMIFHLDLIKFNLMLRNVRNSREDFITIFRVTGTLEALISIGAYRSSIPYYTIPVINADGDTMQIRAQQMVHPLLRDPVANSFRAERGMLLTGSNASGKSTFLKMVAVNAILAQSIHTVTAESYEASAFRVYTSMSLRDDLSGGDSYFIVEIKALKRIMDAKAQPGRPVLCFVDEVLRGTNTVERIAASCEILGNLGDKHCICLAATHDIELTQLLEDQFDNYHFEETIRENDILFNYRLMEGKARTRNAIQLLRILGFQDSMIEKANRRAENFVKKGVWKE